MVKVYRASVEEITNEQFETEISKQSAQRLKSISGKGKFEEKRILTAFLLIRQAVHDFCGIDDYTLRYRNYKPVLPVCNLSVSRYGKYVTLAISDNRIGIDMEKINAVKKRSRYFMFSDKENYYVNKMSGGISERYWEVYSKKYAYAKMKGYPEGEIANVDVTEISDAEFKTEKFGSYLITYCEKIK